LLRSGADVDVFNKANKTAAELASENGKAKIATFISDYKADASILNKVRSGTLDTAQSRYDADEDGKDEAMVSLHAAVKEGNVEVVQLMLERGADINSRDAHNRTPLQRAASSGKLDVARLLVDRGAEVEPPDRRGWTPLHSASRYGHLEISRILVDHGANVNARQSRRSTPLGLSARSGHLGIVKLLLEHGADINARNDKGETPYQVSQRSGSRETIDFLRERSAGITRFEEIFLWLKCNFLLELQFQPLVPKFYFTFSPLTGGSAFDKASPASESSTANASRLTNALTASLFTPFPSLSPLLSRSRIIL
jgi:ankyrin repeat protein